MGEHQTIVERIRKNDPTAIKIVYKTAWPFCAKYVTSNSGSFADAKDIHQKVIITFCAKAQSPSFVVQDGQLKAFLNTMIFNIWKEELT